MRAEDCELIWIIICVIYLKYLQSSARVNPEIRYGYAWLGMPFSLHHICFVLFFDCFEVERHFYCVSSDPSSARYAAHASASERAKMLVCDLIACRIYKTNSLTSIYYKREHQYFILNHISVSINQERLCCWYEALILPSHSLFILSHFSFRWINVFRVTTDMEHQRSKND